MMFSETLVHYRNLLSVLVKDWRRYRRALIGRDASYLELCNRYERLEAAPDGKGYRCDWQWTSDLHAPKFLPSLGLRLMRRALADHPIGRASAPENNAQQPDISFVIGHRGLDRLAQLLAALESIAAQRNLVFECIVVEQSVLPEIKESLPDWVRYVHAPPPHPDAPYCRALAFNCGAALARGDVLVFHDNDLLVPQGYASEITKRFAEGYDVINLKRFIFYLSSAHSQRVCVSGALDFNEAPESIMQNAQGGGSLAISRDAYLAIGGFDESFVGWGGEDNEFWERAQTRNVWPYGYMPLVHLWHEAQPGKFERERETAALHESRSAVPVEKRIAELKAQNFGCEVGRSADTATMASV